jgi:hypothetical protein
VREIETNNGITIRDGKHTYRCGQNLKPCLQTAWPSKSLLHIICSLCGTVTVPAVSLNGLVMSQ